MMLSLDTAYRSFGGEVEASSTPTICRLPDSRRHQLSAIAPVGGHPGRVPAFHGLVADRTLEAADLAFGSHRLGAVVDRSANTGSVTGLFHLLIMRRESELGHFQIQLRTPGLKYGQYRRAIRTGPKS